MQKREEAKEIIRGKVKGKIDYSALKKEFKRINNIRNALIHCNTINTSVKDMIKILRESINKLEPWFK
jgi:archaellum component FlaC